MNEEAKSLALALIKTDIAYGFRTDEEIEESVAEQMEEDVDDIDLEWLQLKIKLHSEARAVASKSWAQPTDFQRLAQVFDELVKNKIIALHFAGYTQQDSIGEAVEVAEALRDNGEDPIGYCFYHEQDLERAIGPENPSLLIGFGTFVEGEEGERALGQLICTHLGSAGFVLDWDGSEKTRITILNIDWKKLPGGGDWTLMRAFNMFPRSSSSAAPASKAIAAESKPWWKFW
jgi:hypothetical protein